jgi:hypothetical protein
MFIAFVAAKAQTGYDTTTFYGKMNFTYAHLNKAKITTGILREYGIDFINQENYTGKIMHDSNWVNLTDWRVLYASLYSQQITNASNLLTLDSVNKRVSQYAMSNQALTFVSLYYNYQGFDTNAVNRNLISISNGQLYDAAPPQDIQSRNKKLNKGTNSKGDNESPSIIIPTPYITYSTFAIAPTQQKLVTGNTSFIFRPELFLSNTSKTISTLQIAPYTNGVYQTVTFNTPFNVNYTDTGIYNINFKVTYTDGSINYSHTKLAVYPNSDSAANLYDIPTVNENISATKSYLGAFAQGDITIELSQNNTTGFIRKPLIIVEGFDPDGTYRYSTRGGYLDNINVDRNSRTNITLNQGLDDINDYDLIFLNFANGTDYIQRNAFLLEAVIQNINSRKIPFNGVMEQNVIIGMSMGGLVVRYALRDMEINSLPHDTRLFISHDAPQWGANVPVAYQALVQQLAPWKIINTIGNFPFISYEDMFPAAVDAKNLFNTAAAKQMLLQRYNLNVLTGSLSADNSTHNSFMAELDNMGWPVQSRNVAISNGKCTGEAQFANYTKMLSIYGAGSLGSYWQNLSYSLLLALGGNTAGVIATNATIPIINLSLQLQSPLSHVTTRGALYFDFGAWSVPSGSTQRIYQGDIYVKRELFWGLLNITSYILKCHSNSSSEMLPLDNAPGGRYDIEQFGINIDNVNAALHQQFFNWVNASVPQRSFCFIPTVSSLALANPQQNLFANVCNTATCLKPAAISDFYAPPNDEIHVSYTQASTNWILNAQNPAQVCELICTNGVTLTGPDLICTSGTYTLNNMPVNGTAVWPTSSYYTVTLLNPAGTQVTVTKTSGSFSVNVTAEIRLNGLPNCNFPVYVAKFVRMGPPSATSYIPYFTTGGNTNYLQYQSYLLDYTFPGFFSGDIHIVDPVTDQITWTKLSETGTNFTSISGSADGKDVTVTIKPQSGSVIYQMTASNTCGSYSTNYRFTADNVVCFNTPGTDSLSIITLQPNPTNGRFVVTLQSTNKQASIKEIIIKNKEGMPVFRKQYTNPQKSQQVQMPVAATNIYIVEIFDGIKWQTQKLSVLK